MGKSLSELVALTVDKNAKGPDKSAATRMRKALNVPAVRERESYRLDAEDPVIEPLQRDIVRPEDLQGRTLVPVYGDRTRRGVELDNIRGVPLDRLVSVQGGPGYTLDPLNIDAERGWSSMKGAARAKQNTIDWAAENADTNPIAAYVAMGRSGSNFSTPVALSMVAQIPALGISKANIEAFNRAVRRGTPGNPGIKDFVGVDDPRVWDQLIGHGNYSREGAGAVRKAVIEQMQKAEWRDKGFPIYEDVIDAVTVPELADINTLDSGFVMFETRPGADLTPEPDHLSYDTAIPGQSIGGMEQSVPVREFWRKSLKQMRDEGKENIPRIFQMARFKEVVDQEWVDRVSKYLEDNKGATMQAALLAVGTPAAMMVASDTEAGIRGYHGSPAKFDQFSDEFIGTGEGAQAFGRGHYLAEVEGTARGYRDSLSSRNPKPTYKGRGYDQLDGPEYRALAAIEQEMRFNKNLTPAQAKDQAVTSLQLRKRRATENIDPERRATVLNEYDEDIDALQGVDANEVVIGGSMYEVEVDADLDDLIDYDRPLSQQSQKVQEVMASFGITDPDLKGSQLYYKVIDPETPVQQAPELATRTLNEAGIKGIRYADGFSRGQDGGTSNYVIFDPRIIDISKRYGIPVTAVTSMLAAQEADAANARKMQAESNTNFAATRDSKNNMWDGLKQSVSQASSVMPQQSFIADTAETMGRGLVSGTLGVLGNLPMEGSLGRMGLDYFGIGPEQIEGYREDIKADPLFADPNNPYSQALNRAMETSLQYISPYVSEFTSQPEIRATLGSIGDWYSNLSPRSRGILSGAGEYLANLPK